mgnify:CR=1 FL=1
MTQRFFLWLMSGVLSALIVGCSSAPKPLPPPAPMKENRSVLSQDKRQDVVIQSMAMLDRNYTYGGKKLHTGFDCSGLVSFVYKQSAGVNLQGSAADMAKRTQVIDAQSAQPGDLVFFNTLGTPNSHVGIYIGSGKFIHAANERTGVRQERLDNSYWSKRFEGFRTLN